MFRTSAPEGALSWGVGAIVLAAMASFATAAPPTTTTEPPDAISTDGQRLVIPTPPEAFTAPHAEISPILYLERCRGNCTVNRGSVNDARTMTSTIPNGPGPFTIHEFLDKDQQSGDAATPEWNAVVQCMKEVYSPFNVMVTDVKPTGGVSHHVAIIAGLSGDIGQPNQVLGVAPLAQDCRAQDNVISFSFANSHSFVDPNRVLTLCWTAAQESAHAFGLDHSYEFTDHRSACNDPMTYRTDCGGQKFFRNEPAACGTTSAVMCQCGTNQNSHAKLLTVFGAGQSLIPPPTATITLPHANDGLGAVVGATAFSKRGVARVELFLNDHEFAEAKGAPFGVNGQPESGYTLTLPSALPRNSKLDVVVKAYDDLGLSSSSAVIPSYRGSAAGCTNAADDCLKGQDCDAGKCSWPAATGEIGDDCAYPEFCQSGRCEGPESGTVCTQSCIKGSANSCPMGLDCLEESPGKTYCYPADTGCCSVGRSRGAPLAYAGLSLGVLALVTRRRRRSS